MPRPRKCRKIRGTYDVSYYKPRGVRLSSLEEVNLEIDEMEAIRLIDYEGANMEEAAVSMKISKPTICRLVNSGRQKLADAVCNGKAISIYNHYLTHKNMPNLDGTGPEGKGPKTGRGAGKCKGPGGAGGPGGANMPGKGQGHGRGAGNKRGQGRGRNK